MNNSHIDAGFASSQFWMMRWQMVFIVVMSMILSFGTSFGVSKAYAKKIAPVRIVTEHLPPYQFYDENNHLTGLSVELVEALMVKTMQKSSIEVMPWSEAYKLASDQENVLIFSIIRSKERVNRFKWVGDFLKQHYYFTTLKSRKDIVINNVQDVKKYVTGVASGSFEQELLNRYGFAAGQNLQVNDDQFPLIKQLLDGEIDLIFGSKVTVMGMMNYIDQDVSKLKFVYQLNETPGSFGIAFSRQTSDEVVERFRHGFELMKKDGTVNRVVNKWLLSY